MLKVKVTNGVISVKGETSHGQYVVMRTYWGKRFRLLFDIKENTPAELYQSIQTFLAMTKTDYPVRITVGDSFIFCSGKLCSWDMSPYPSVPWCHCEIELDVKEEGRASLEERRGEMTPTSLVITEKD